MVYEYDRIRNFQGSELVCRCYCLIRYYQVFIVKFFKCVLKEIKKRLKSGNACFHSAQTLLSSSLLNKNIKIKIYKSIILPILYGCETPSLPLRGERRLRVFEIGCCGEYLGLRGTK